MFKRFSYRWFCFIAVIPCLVAGLLLGSFPVSAAEIPRSGIHPFSSCKPNTLMNPSGTYLSGSYEVTEMTHYPDNGYYTFSTSDGNLYWYDVSDTGTILYKFVDGNFVASTDISGTAPAAGYYIWKYDGELYWTYNSVTYKLVDNVWTRHSFLGFNPSSYSNLQQIDGNLYCFYRESTDLPYSVYLYSDGGFYLDETFVMPPNYDGYPFWSDGTNTFYSSGSAHYKLTSSGEWSEVTFSGVANFNGSGVFTDGYYVYLTSWSVFGSNKYVYRLNGTQWEIFLTLEKAIKYSGFFSDGSYIYICHYGSPSKLTLTEDVISSSVSSVSVSALDSSVYPGTTVTYTATVSGTGDYSTAVTWSVSGATSSETSISDTGELKVAPDETSSIITVTATSVQDTSVSGSYSLEVTPFPADELVLFPGYSTALEGVAFSQQFTIGYKDGTPFEYGNPVWGAYIYPMDSIVIDLEELPTWASISETGVLSLTAESIAGYRIVPFAKLGSEYITGASVVISSDEKDYLKDIINGSDEQQGEASDFKDKANSDAEQMQDAIDQLDQVTMPNIDDVDIDIWNMIDASGFAAINSILGVLWSNNIVMTVITFAFILAMVGFFIFGKR